MAPIIPITSPESEVLSDEHPANRSAAAITKIAANAVVLAPLPENSTAVGIPARVVRRDGKKVVHGVDLDQVHIPDPVSQELCRMQVKINQLEKKLKELEK